ncbi:MAG: hypothetical protein LBL39_06810 [Planctomycetaceae bacterium]|nr:hypothetical protein [Planctomycetaceae bacterium]
MNGYENSKTLIRIVRITKKQVKSKIFDRDGCGCLGKTIELLTHVTHCLNSRRFKWDFLFVTAHEKSM